MTSSASLLLDVEKSLLVVIDEQQRLISAMPEHIASSVVHQTSVLAQAANKLNVPAIVTEQYPEGLGATDTVLAKHLSTTNKIEKTCFSCSKIDDFMAMIRTSHRRQIVLTGMEAHICVLQTALTLFAQGFQVFVVEDAVCSRNQKNNDNAMQRLRQAGVIVTNSESVLFEWLSDAKHQEFKTLSKLIL